MENAVKKIVVVGPESTGKSSLCTQLAAHYSTLWCPEYAREYLLQNGIDYRFADLLTIAKGQLQLEERYMAEVSSRQPPIKAAEGAGGAVFSKNPLFIDTDMYVMKVWCEFVFGDCHAWILNEIVQRPYHLYLLCKPDLPWVKDELREYPDLESREQLYHIYRDLLINQTTPWAEISGGYEERLQQAIAAVAALD